MRKRLMAASLLVALLLTAFPAVVSAGGGCQGQYEGSHNPSPGQWWTPPLVGQANLIVHFWTNWPGHSQDQFKVKISSDKSVQLAGGGSVWSFASGCTDAWLKAYANDPLPGHKLRWMRNHGLARNT